MRRLLAALAAATLIVATASGVASAAPSPTVTLDRDNVSLGDRIIVTLHDWPERGAVVISVCGNLAHRGSVDCNLADSQGIGVTPYIQPVTELVIKAPPTTCPCVIRASNSTQDVVAYAPIAIAGVPTGPVVGAPVEVPLALGVRVHRAHQSFLGWLQSSLGGPTPYELTVAVRNKSPEDLPGVRLIARAGRSADDQARIIDIKAPDVVPVGKTWTRTERITMSAPVFGRFIWSVSASGAGPTVRAEATAYHLPLLLLVLVLLIVGDVTAMVVRWLKRRADRRHSDDDGPDDHGGATDQAAVNVMPDDAPAVDASWALMWAMPRPCPAGAATSTLPRPATTFCA